LPLGNQKAILPFFEIARVLERFERFDHFARMIVNANHGIM
jgi:hypothetical protein